jgi:hypothetical protein
VNNYFSPEIPIFGKLNFNFSDMNQKNRKSIIGSFRIIAALWLVCAAATLSAQTRILEGRLLNLAGEPVVGATGVLGTNNKETSVTGIDGYYIFTTTQNPTNISITPQDVSKLTNGPVRREIVDLTGKIIDSQEGFLGVGDELDGFSSAVHLKHHSVYIQRLMDSKGGSVTQRFVSVPNTVDQIFNETKAILKSASAEVGQNTIQNFNADFSGPTFKDTVFVLPIVRTEMSAYNDLRMNEIAVLHSRYQTKLDTIVNSPVIELDMTKIWKDDDFKNLEFEVSGLSGNYVQIDKQQNKIILDRRIAPTKGNFSITAKDGSSRAKPFNVSYNVSAMELDLIVRNSVTSELLDDADIYLNSFDNHLKLAELIKDENGYVRLYAQPGQTNIVRVDREKYGFADATSKSDTIKAFVAPSDFPMAFYNDLNRGTGVIEVVKWEEGKQLTMKVLTIDEGTKLPLPESKYKELSDFGLTLENMMKEKGIDDKPFSSMKVEYINSIDYENLTNNALYITWNSNIPAQGFIGFWYMDADPNNYVNLRNFTACRIRIRNNMGEINTFITKLQEYMSAFYGKGPPRHETIPEDGSLFREGEAKNYITNSDVKIIKHHINQPNGSWYTNDAGKNVGIEVTKDAAKKNNVNELIPKLEYFR